MNDEPEGQGKSPHLRCRR